MHDKKLVKTIRKRGLGVSGNLVLHARICTREQTENVTGAVNTCSNGMLYFQYVGNRVSRVMVSRKYISRRSKILKKTDLNLI